VKTEENKRKSMNIRRGNVSMEKLTLTVKEMAEMLGISLPTAYELTEREGFPLLRVASPVERSLL